MSINSDIGNREIEHRLKEKLPRKIHFSGIGGAGMTPLAMLLSELGFSVSGTDLAESDNVRRLRELGIDVRVPHIEELPASVGLLVRSLAVPDNSPELEYSRAEGIPVWSRAQLLGAVASAHGRTVAVAGSHGKSTTTAMLDCIFSSLSLYQSTVSGARLSDGETLRIGDGSLFLCEACEYRRAFLHIKPSVALITNIELDHTDTYGSEEEIYSAFLKLAESAELVILGVDTPLSRRLSLESNTRVVTFGEGEADFSLESFSQGGRGSSFRVRWAGGEDEINLSVPGIANAKDALGAYALCMTLGLPRESVKRALSGFSGIDRRLELLGFIEGRAVYYDYAHHPTEIINTISTLKELHGRVSVLFRPHTYSRTSALFSDFVSSLGLADFVTLVEIYAAREENLFGVSSEGLACAIGERAVCVDTKDALSHILSSTEGAIVLMGAGDIDGIIKEAMSLME